MENDYTPDFLTLLDEDNKEHNFEILDTLEQDDSVYYALLPVIEDEEEALQSNSEYYIMELVEVDGEEELLEVEDDELADKLAEIFEERFEELYFSDEE